MTPKEFAAVLVEAEGGGLIGIAHEVAWYDGPIFGIAITDEVYAALPEAMRDGKPRPQPNAASSRPKWVRWEGGRCVTCGLQANRCECERPQPNAASDRSEL